MNILFIDDHPEFLREMVAQLEDHGHTVKGCLRADDAVEELGSVAKYDIIVLDIMMRLGSLIRSDEAPETGIAIYQRVRKIAPTLPILVVSALSKDRFWQQCGFAKDQHVMYFAKPLAAEDNIYDIVKRAIR